MESNFAFLNDQFPVLGNFGELAEKYLYSDSNSCLMKLGMIGETIVNLMFTYDQIPLPRENTAVKRIDVLLRKIRNKAVHENYSSVEKGKALLQMAHSLSEWFMQTYGDWDYQSHLFVMPSENPESVTDDKENEQVKEEKLLKVYEAAKVEIPEMIKKSLDEVAKFHGELLETRNARLRKELARHKSELKEIDTQITSLGKRMDELLDYLNSHGALEEYVALTKQLSSLQNDLNRIQEYQKILKAYRDTKLDIRASMIEQDKSADAYLEEENAYLDNLKNSYWNYAKRFYPKKKSGLVIRNNLGENMLRYTLEARIEDDSSDGVNEVRMFCFDWLLLNCQKSKIKFVAHDSRMFANMDPRQRETLFRIAFETCQTTDFQYICSVNEDALLSFESMMTEEEYQDIVKSNIILELNDDSPESKLLGIQIDIDLEDKGKAFDDVS